MTMQDEAMRKLREALAGGHVPGPDVPSGTGETVPRRVTDSAIRQIVRRPKLKVYDVLRMLLQRG